MSVSVGSTIPFSRYCCFIICSSCFRTSSSNICVQNSCIHRSCKCSSASVDSQDTMLQVSSYNNSNWRNCSPNCPANSFQISRLYNFKPKKSVTYVSLSKSEIVIFSLPSRIALSRFPHKSRKANRSISLWCIPITLLVNNSLLRNIIKSETSKINIKFLYCEIFQKRKDFVMQKIRPDMDISKNIQAIRYANKLTQDQVIAKLNLMGISMSKSTYAKLETNRMNIKVSELVALAKIFHTDINAFFSGLL